MARTTTKKEEIKEEVVETKETTTKSTKKSDNSELSEIMKQMKEMQEQIIKLQKEKSVAESLVEQLRNSSDSKSESGINADTDVLVISQTVGQLNLSTDGYGLGTVYTFEKMGDDQFIPFGDLRDICKNMPTFAQQGLFYIQSAEAVEKLRLKKYYSRMIDNDDMANIFNKTAEGFIETYKLATDLQREQIISLIIDKRNNNEKVDMNVLAELSELCGKDLINLDN